jgi:anti-sigma regulatory factor (Ser/Thr protein kinase)
MILEKQKKANVLTEGQTQETIGMSLDLDSAQILMQMLSKNLYSDDIGSAIRECASNALDSHRRANVDTPIVVSLKAASYNNYEFCVEDFGIGLDADDVRNIISKYGKSTKRESTTELGMMGLGFKAPLAYSSSFYFVCRKDGMERKYMMYEGEDANTIDLLYEKPTEESNGVKIIIPVKYNDVWQFKKKIKEQLCYFESVYFDVPEDKSITNDFVISRHTHFQFSEMSTDDKLHICLDNVYYPLDFEKLGISRIDFPIALRFSLSDGLYPTPNRESINKDLTLKFTNLNN